ncbi:hypothetical protein [uncultured Thiodictyon sp.]|uniref:hypothetical protein n=1 Tax=uncultured Thiodictyon sp. TaxID=1846217 RepID=UPI0025F0D519|nr:hypothetical protein [uncultured Thiodictyon sp.]
MQFECERIRGATMNSITTTTTTTTTVRQHSLMDLLNLSMTVPKRSPRPRCPNARACC